VTVPLGFLLTVASGLYAQELNWPDYYHVEYGYPLPWLVRTLSTIAGPTDKLEFQMASFAMDWVFWWVVAVIFIILATRLLRVARI